MKVRASDQTTILVAADKAPVHKHTPAPYDEKNAADYAEMSNRIARALHKLEHDPTLLATETELARLANCSRGTLRNRAYPLVRLKLIQEKRKTAKSVANSPSPTTSQIQKDDRKKLQDELKNSRTEVARWFEKYVELESALKKEKRARELLVAEKNALVDRVTKLEARVRLSPLNPVLRVPKSE